MGFEKSFEAVPRPLLLASKGLQELARELISKWCHVPEASRAVSGVSASRSAELPQAQGCRGKERRMRLRKVKEKARHQNQSHGARASDSWV